MNMIVIFENTATRQCQEGKPYLFASALKVQCLCGNLIHPIPGAWCTQCGLKVMEVRTDFADDKGNCIAGGAPTENRLLDLQCVSGGRSRPRE